MKIPPKDIESFITNIPKNIKAILLYGQDSGLVQIRRKIISQSRKLSGNFKYEQVKHHPYLLADSLHSPGLFEEKSDLEKLLLIDCDTASLTDPVLKILKISDYKGLIVFCAKELATDSSLRKFFENNSHVAAVPCYIDDQVTVAKITQQYFRDKQTTCESGVIPLLLNYITLGNRALLLNELEKISLFMGNKNHILLGDLQNYLETQEDVNFDKLCYTISLRLSNEVDPLIDKLQNEGHNLVSIIRTVTRHFNRLYQAKLLIKHGKTEQQAMSSLSPPVFFKQTNDFSKSIKLWEVNQLIATLKKLTNAELSAKKTIIPANLILKRLAISYNL